MTPPTSDWVSDYEAHETDYFPKGKQMGRYATGEDKAFQQAPIDTHVARCIGIWDIGTQHGEYKGKPTTNNQVIIRWELPDALMDDGQPFIVSTFVNNFIGGTSKLRGWLEAWRGRPFTEEELKGFDLQKVVGQPCLLTVGRNDKDKAIVTAVTKLPKGMEPPAQVNPSSSFWLDEFTQASFDKLPEGIQKIVIKSDEYRAMTKGGSDPARHFDDMEDDVPNEEPVPF